MLPAPAKRRQGRVTSLRVTLTDGDRRILEAWQRSTTMPIGLANRGRIILLMAQGWPISRIARAIPMSRRFVYKWTARFLVHGIDGLHDLPRPGAGSHRTKGRRAPRRRSCRQTAGNLTLTLPGPRGQAEDRIR
jgi:hypothetical protein